MFGCSQLLFDANPEIGRAVRANLETSYVAYSGGPGLDPLVLEANLAPHFSLLPLDWRAALIVSPKVLLRLFAEESLPVKTPSYMPRIAAFGWLSRSLDRPAYYATLGLSHHSNGQSGAFFEADGSNNHDSGDFATNYLELGLGRVTRSEMLFGWAQVWLEWHPGIGQSDELEGRYGLVRLHVAATVVRRLALDGSLYAELSAILDDFEAASGSPFLRTLERFPFRLRYTARIPRMNVGLFTGLYVGHDYYNIWFDRMIFAIMVGMSGDLWAFPHEP